MIYLLDGEGQRIGPFENREGVERFVKMMELCGENWADSKIVEEDGDDAPGRDPDKIYTCASQLAGAGKLRLVGRKP